MDQKIIDQLLAEIPREIRTSVKPLSNEKTWAVLILLLKNQPMRFNGIKDFFNTSSPGEIDRILKSLAAAGLIEKRAADIEHLGEQAYFVYSVTDTGRAVVEGLFRSVFGIPATNVAPATREKKGAGRGVCAMPIVIYPVRADTHSFAASPAYEPVAKVAAGSRGRVLSAREVMAMANSVSTSHRPRKGRWRSPAAWRGGRSVESPERAVAILKAAGFVVRPHQDTGHFLVEGGSDSVPARARHGTGNYRKTLLHRESSA